MRSYRDKKNIRKGKEQFGPQSRGPRLEHTNLGAHDLVLGRHALEELLKHDPSVLIQVHTTSGEHDQRHAKLLNDIKGAEIPLQIRTQAELSALAGTPSHQSFVSLRKPREYVELKDWLKSVSDINQLLVVALDSVLDPHNTGAILRASECFGADLVLWSKNRSSGITPIVTGVSVGASELLTLCEVSNLAQALGMLRDEAFQLVVADEGDDSVALDQYQPADRVAFIFGSEGLGVQQLIRREAEIKVRIPMKGRISSLNVSQAAAVVLNSFSHKRT